MENRNFFQELSGYRVKVERNGKEIVNLPGILCLPGLLAAPRMSIAGLVAAPLLGCSIHLGNDNGKEVNIEDTMRKAAETVIDTASTAARTVREEFEKAWQAVSADDPEEEPETEETKETEETEAAPGRNAAEKPDQDPNPAEEPEQEEE